MDNRKKELAKKLQEEKETLPEINFFHEKTNFEDYDLSIKYLLTNEHPKKYNDFDLLYTCIEDFEQICMDYDVK
jgi:hypothetical protein